VAIVLAQHHRLHACMRKLVALMQGHDGVRAQGYSADPRKSHAPCTRPMQQDMIKEKGAIIFIYPKANTGGCTIQVRARAAGCTLEGISYPSPRVTRVTHGMALRGPPGCGRAYAGRCVWCGTMTAAPATVTPAFRAGQRSQRQPVHVQHEGLRRLRPLG
jgi:hypothetical protein